ncbi:MAG: hypothetical protein ABIS35_14610 [Terracoccus sp.]
MATAPRDAPDPTSALPSWLRTSLVGVLLVFVAVRVVEPLRDPDSFWHIAAGTYLTRSWDFVTHDPWSASSSEPWIFNQWLPELAMSGAHRLGGYPAVVWLFSVAAVGVVLAVWATCRARASMLSAAVTTAMTLYAIAGSLSPRPQLVSFALTAVTVHAWLRSIEDHRPRWWLIPLAWLWACSHGMWFLGGAVGLAVVAGLAVGRTVRPAALARLALVAVGCLAVGAITPAGPGLLASPFQVHGVTAFITEWQPPAPTDPQLLLTLALTGLAVLGAGRLPRAHRWPRLLLCAMALGLALSYVRTIGLAAVLVAPMAAATLHDLTGLHREPSTRRELSVTAAFSAVALTLSGVLAWTTATDSGLGPEGLRVALSAAPTGSVVCNDLPYGGWLILEEPGLRPTMDSRFEVYSVEQILAYRDFISGGPGWQHYVAETGCTYALLGPESAIAERLTRAGWQVTAASKGTRLLRRS